ncbi:hypothetical protein [Rhodobacter xanthinilyticus]|uniref:hypothetical protein n=1 Tax=Rhodobacter xanthinilyticus TaxID=1850250 RepID=UPI0012E7568E|nr:hypothetical protein [Rhodobacter xanthinilyticus]
MKRLRIIEKITRRMRSEDGAVTVDWVVLTAAIVGVGMAFGSMISDQAIGVGDKVANHISTIEVVTE